MELDSSVFSVRDILDETIRSFSVTAAEAFGTGVRHSRGHSAGSGRRCRDCGSGGKSSWATPSGLQTGADCPGDRGRATSSPMSNCISRYVTRESAYLGKQLLIFEAAQPMVPQAQIWRDGVGADDFDSLGFMMGGRIWLESEPGQEAPFISRQNSPGPARCGRPKPMARQPLGHPCSVVDDNPTNRRIRK
jgi:hypothetical protein